MKNKPIHFIINTKSNKAEILKGTMFEHWEMVQAAFRVGFQLSDGTTANGIGRCASMDEFIRKASHGKTVIL